MTREQLIEQIEEAIEIKQEKLEEMNKALKRMAKQGVDPTSSSFLAVMEETEIELFKECLKALGEK